MILLYGCISNETGMRNGKEKKPKETEQKDKITNEYFPLDRINEINYVNERDNNDIITIKVLEKKIILNEVEIKLSSFPYMTKDDSSRTILITKQGEIEINNYMGSSGVIIPSANNFYNGYKWKFGIFTGRVSKIEDIIHTPLGEYSDLYYVLLTEGFTFSFEMWFKKGAGIIKWGANRTNPPVLHPTYYVVKSIIK